MSSSAGRGASTRTTTSSTAASRPRPREIFHNVARLLKSAGASLDDVVSCLVHLADLNDYAALNDEYAKHFPAEKPVRTTVRADLVAGMHVEITVVAKQP